MKTKVILDGVLGKRFGREWDIVCNSPRKALQIIEANKPGLIAFIRQNLNKYNTYQVIVDDDERDDESYGLSCKAKVIRFVPVVTGAGGGFAKVVLGAVLIAMSFIPGLGVVTATGAMTTFGSMSMAMGISLVLGGVTQMLTKQPSTKSDKSQSSDKTNHYFDGPTNTERQGIGLPLIYGRCLVGSHPISVKMVIREDKS